MSDAGTRLLFEFRSGTHGLNEELGRHRGREGKLECALCAGEYECASAIVSGSKCFCFSAFFVRRSYVATLCGGM